MKTRIVDISEMEKEPEEREAEEVLNQICPGKAVGVTLTGEETRRKITRLYRKAARNLQKKIRVMNREGKVIIVLK